MEDMLELARELARTLQHDERFIRAFDRSIKIGEER